MKALLKSAATLAILGGAAAWWLSAPASVDAAAYAGLTPDATRGEQVYWAAGCASCHMDEETKDKTLLTGGMWFRHRALRSLINDEVSESNRQKGVAAAFVAAMLVAVLIFAVAPFEPIPAQRAAHLVVTVSLAVGLLVFALAERKSLG